MPRNPLAEVFGYPVDNFSSEANDHRSGRLCPYNNPSGINCTKVSATDPIGVCSVREGERIVATCPVRFREGLKIVAASADFFFPGSQYVALTEARLNDKLGKSAGNIDIVIAALDDHGRIQDFGAVEVQAVYISGNVTKAFRKYMENPTAHHNMDWPRKNYPRPDYLSSSRKRLAPQLIYKGGILNHWQKKMAVVVDENFFDQLPKLPEVDKTDADVAWLIYNFKYSKSTQKYNLTHKETKYTDFTSALDTITTPSVGDVKDFINYLQERVRKNKIKGLPAESPLEPEVEPPLDATEEDD